jgi:thiol-disulfide isomerase/thioredoxin
MDEMDQDFPSCNTAMIILEETSEEYVYKTKKRIRAMNEKEVKELLYWAIQDIKGLKVSAKELRDVKDALRIINDIRRN